MGDGFDIAIYSHDVLRWMHVIFAAYWLGGEWGVFNASTNVAKADLSLEERLRHMETAYRIDIMPRSSIIWLLPVGFHMADNLGLSPVSGMWVNVVWAATALWWLLIWMAFRARGTQRGIMLTELDDKIRFVVIPALILTGGYMLVTGNMAFGGEELPMFWFATKLSLFGFILIIGLLLRFTMKDWAVGFNRLKAEGPKPEINDIFTTTLSRARKYAYVYWIGIGTMAFIGVTKPF
ncbi:hypothetical protein [Eilatimonas milleporae]|uniref:Urate oxidase N-terminal domain-containing protein n=1 Tax=Eilatimonas milleporae TaxID=911205 RepID=A0A3M0CXG9_9PROT|nr:hypothetical protein [Eilatimonas milleporae]RMB12216.1 hypothetical protein BXY39_0709 [Eilatimonas milleporae]